jgi:lipoate-protein ligase A
MKSWRLLNNGHIPGVLNMAIDRALLEMHAMGSSPPTLRFYQWRPPAVSLGYFQRDRGLDRAICQQLGVEIIRRTTGGKAVLHQGDLTYSIVAGVDDGLPIGVEAAYQMLCEGLILGFRHMGIEATLGREASKSKQLDVCFLRAGVGDIVYRGRKFVGSAQRWNGNSLLQHGSIILEPQVESLMNLWGSCHACPDDFRKLLTARLTSIQGILGRLIEPSEVALAITEGLRERFQLSFVPGSLTPDEWAMAHEFINREPGKAQLSGRSFSVRGRQAEKYQSLKKEEHDMRETG